MNLEITPIGTRLSIILKRVAMVLATVATVVFIGVSVHRHFNPPASSPPAVPADRPSPSKDISALKLMLTHYEGESLKVYLGPRGNLTVGIGHEVTAEDNLKRGDSITEAMSHTLFVRDVEQAITDASTLVDDFAGLNAARQHVIIGMIFQMGVSSVRGFHHFLDAVNNHNYGQASLEMLYSDSETKTPSAWWTETPKRCEEMAKQMRTGKFDRYTPSK